MNLQFSTINFNIDEFNIKFTKNSSFEELRKFVKEHSSYRINIEFLEENYLVENVIDFCHDFDNVYVRIHPWELKYLAQYDENSINYIFDSSMPIYSYSLLEFALGSHTKGIYIMDDLTYNLPEVYKQCNDKGIELRVILDKVPTTNSLTLVCPSVQIYRPQDYDFLSQYYAVGEFSCDENDLNKLEVLYKRWFITHDWDADLEFMNRDLQLPYPTESIPPELTRLRSKCQHRCTMRADNICSKCRRLLLMGYYNADNNLVYKDPEYGLPSLETLVDSIIISKKDNVE